VRRHRTEENKKADEDKKLIDQEGRFIYPVRLMGGYPALRCSVFLLLAVVWWVPTVRADVYLERDAEGTLQFTNVPTAARARLVLPDLPPLTRRRVLRTSPTRYDHLIREIAARHNVRYALVKAVIRAESGFNPRAVSHKGAQGLMQLMPATAALHNVRNAFSPRDNIEGGVKHLRMLLDYYGGNVVLSLAAYNAGRQAVAAAGQRVPPYEETRTFVRRVLAYRVAYLRDRRHPAIVSRR
jgi:soluble lytic murein transglycosylase-like protein